LKIGRPSAAEQFAEKTRLSHVESAIVIAAIPY
jgi:hypothetical protein